jgi:hypothetical protein
MLLKKWRKARASRGSAKARRWPTARPWLEPLEDRNCPAPLTLTWTAAVNNAWDNPGNWDGNAVPGVLDTAVFDPTVANVGVNSPTDTPNIAQLKINTGYNATISLKGLTIGGAGTDTSTVQGGSISLAANGWMDLFDGTLNWSAGSISSLFAQPGSTPPPFTVGDATHLVTVNMSVSANFAGPFDLYNSGKMTISTSSNNVTVGNGSLIVNYVGATIDVQSDVGFVGSPMGGRGSFTNNGAFKKSAGTGTTGVAMPFTNASALAVFEVQTGTVSLNASGDQTQTAGTTQIYVGATLAVATTYVVSAGIIEGQGGGTSTLTGNLKLTGGNFYVGIDGTIGTFKVTNNYTQSGGTLNIDVNGSSNDLLKVGNQASLGGTLKVNTINGNKPNGAFTIMTYTSLDPLHNEFAGFTWNAITYNHNAGMGAYTLS